MFQLSSVFVSPQVHVGVAVPSLYLLFQPIDIIMQTSETPVSLVSDASLHHFTLFQYLLHENKRFLSLFQPEPPRLVVPLIHSTLTPRLGTIYIRT